MSIDEAGLRSWVTSVVGEPVLNMERLVGGASRVSYRVGLESGACLLLRVDTGGGPLSGTPFDLAREHRVLDALARHGAAVPPIIGFSARHQALLMGFVEGSNSYQKDLPPGQQAQQQRQLLSMILDLQRLPPVASGLVQGTHWPSLGDALEREIDIWEGLHRRRVSSPQPLLSFCWRWLRQRAPATPAHATLVHGDLGPGNFLFDDSGDIRALIDWELAHLGHPLEDLACILCRSLGSPFGDPADLVRWYGELSGMDVDRDALRYTIVLVLARWSVGINMALSHPNAELDVPMLLTFRQSNVHALLSQLAAVHGEVMPEVEPLSGRALPWHDYLLANLGEVLPRHLAQDFARHRLAGLARLVTYLRDQAVYGLDRYEEEERERIAVLLGRDCGDLESARAALDVAAASGTACDDGALLRHLLWWGAREQALLTAAMGPMANRRIRF